MTQTEFDTLLSLLDDPDETVNAAVTAELGKMGSDILPMLERAWQQCDDKRISKILADTISAIRVRRICDDAREWRKSGARDLLAGAAIYNQILFPNVSPQSLISRINSIKTPIWTELNDNLTALEKVRIINHFMFNINRFAVGDEQTTQSYFLSTLLNTSKAGTSTMAVLYAIVAQSLGLPIYCVALPHSLTLCYVDELETDEFENNVMFYIDVRTRGQAYGSSEITDYLRSSNIDPKTSYYKPCSNLKAIIYLLSLLAAHFTRLRDEREQTCMQIIEILTNKQ